MQTDLTTGVRATTSTDDVVQVKKNYPIYRILVHIYSDVPQKNMLIKDYYVWMTEDFASDALHMREALQDKDYALAALQELVGRFMDNDNEVPPENGIDCSNENGVVPIMDAENYVHPVEKDAIKIAMGARVENDPVPNIKQ